MESVYDQVAIRIRNHESRQKLYRMTCMTGDLAENSVFFEQWHGNELTEQAFARGFQCVPSRFEFYRSGGPNSIPIIRPLPRTSCRNS
jgi:hypothetical protein